jgi:hypothetical protein
MNINRAITSSTISFRLNTGGTDYLETTIRIIPDTSPGAITVQFPLARVFAYGGCESVANDSFHFEVYDGPYPGGKHLLTTSVRGPRTCSHR